MIWKNKNRLFFFCNFIMLKPEDFVKELGLPQWVLEKLKELKKMQEEEEKKKLQKTKNG